MKSASEGAKRGSPGYRMGKSRHRRLYCGNGPDYSVERRREHIQCYCYRFYAAIFSTVCVNAPPLQRSTRSRSDDWLTAWARAEIVDASLSFTATIWLWIQLTTAARVTNVVLPPTCVERYSRCKMRRLAENPALGDS